MIKLLIYKSATVFSGIPAVGVLTKLQIITLYLHGDSLGVALGVLAAIFGSQWSEYQRCRDSAQSNKPGWLRRLLYTGPLVGCASQSGAQCFENSCCGNPARLFFQI